jgi:Tfp pilus assembly protein PilF
MEDWDAAAREFQRSVDDGIEIVSSLHHLAHIHKSRGDEAQAAALLERAKQMGQSNTR